MRCFLNLLVPAMTLVPLCGIVALAQTPTYNMGRTASQEEIRAWDISIGPEGKELPPGSGTAKEGAQVYAQKCASCHGPTGAEGGSSGDPGRPFSPPLVGGQGTLNTPKPLRTVESYWPFATTVWDYINRGMPRRQEGSLSANEVYAVTAYLFYKSGLIQEGDVLDAQNLPKIPMPNRNGFIPAKPERWWKPGIPSGDRSRTP